MNEVEKQDADYDLQRSIRFIEFDSSQVDEGFNMKFKRVQQQIQQERDEVFRHRFNLRNEEEVKGGQQFMELEEMVNKPFVPGNFSSKVRKIPNSDNCASPDKKQLQQLNWRKLTPEVIEIKKFQAKKYYDELINKLKNQGPES